MLMSKNDSDKLSAIWKEKIFPPVQFDVSESGNNDPWNARRKVMSDQ